MICSILKFEDDWAGSRESFKTRDFHIPGNNIKEVWNSVRLCVLVNINDPDLPPFVLRGIWRKKGKIRLGGNAWGKASLVLVGPWPPSAHDGTLLLLCILEGKHAFIKRSYAKNIFIWEKYQYQKRKGTQTMLHVGLSQFSPQRPWAAIFFLPHHKERMQAAGNK